MNKDISIALWGIIGCLVSISWGIHGIKQDIKIIIPQDQIRVVTLTNTVTIVKEVEKQKPYTTTNFIDPGVIQGLEKLDMKAPIWKTKDEIISVDGLGNTNIYPLGTIKGVKP